MGSGTFWFPEILVPWVAWVVYPQFRRRSTLRCEVLSDGKAALGNIRLFFFSAKIVRPTCVVPIIHLVLHTIAILIFSAELCSVAVQKLEAPVTAVIRSFKQRSSAEFVDGCWVLGLPDVPPVCLRVLRLLVRSGQVRSGQVRSGQVRSGLLLGRSLGP